MYKLIYFIIPIINLCVGKFLIRNVELPTCINCLHFIEHTNNYPYDPIPDNTQYGRCKKFGEVNLINGEIEYDLAKNCRADNSKCGKIGLEYTDKRKS